MNYNVTGPFFLADPTVTVIIYLDMKQHFVPPLVIFHHDSAPPHWRLLVMSSWMRYFWTGGLAIKFTGHNPPELSLYGIMLITKCEQHVYLTWIHCKGRKLT